MLNDIQSIGLFVQIKQVDSFKENKSTWLAIWQNEDKTTG